MALQIFLNGMPKKQKEFMVKLLKVDLKTPEYMFTTSQLVW
jgi:hypothetical protein